MSVRNLDKLFQPRSIALIGASTKPKSVGAALMQNLLRAGFDGPVLPVNPNTAAIKGVLTYPDIARLPLVPDLAVIATPPHTVPQLIADLGSRGTRAVIVISAGVGGAQQEHGGGGLQEMLDAARPHILRIVGPNCLGVAVPRIGLNATFGPSAPLSGNIAFITQSGAMATTVLDWALPRNIGFSAIVSMGDMSDVDFGDLLDYFVKDETTKAILVYAEAVTHARKFMSAARRAARVKSVIVVKAGRLAEGAQAAASHTGALAGSDAVYEAAFRRAGILRVHEIDELFDAATTLARMSPQRGNRLAIITNGGGLGVLATDRLIEEGGFIAALAPATIAKLDTVLPPTWSRANPIDLIGDADAQRYADAVSIVMSDPNADALLVINCPTGVSSPLEAANGLIEALVHADDPAPPRKNVLASWMGDATAGVGRDRLSGARIPQYDTVERAVRAFMHLVRYRESQDLLLQVPQSSASDVKVDLAGAQAIIRSAIADDKEWLDPAEVAAFLRCYCIPMARTEAVANAQSAAQMAAEINGPVALKIRSRDVVHKSDVGGVVLNLKGFVDVREAAERMVDRISHTLPEARLEGFIIQEMITRPGSYELIVGITTDPTFGPVILFGHGGTAVEVVNDKSLELPPLNSVLALAQIKRTRIASLLEGYRDHPPVDTDELVAVLITLSQIAANHAEVIELDVNPLLCDPHGVIALDGRIRVSATAVSAHARMAIRPYPQRFEGAVAADDGTSYFVRPIRPEDAPLLRTFALTVPEEDFWHDFFSALRDHKDEAAARLSQIDYDRELTMIALEGDVLVGIARMTAEPGFERSEFAVLMRKDLLHRGLARPLMERLLEAAAMQGVKQAVSTVPAYLQETLMLYEELGFTVAQHTGGAHPVVNFVRPLC